MSIGRQMDKEAVVYIHNGILLSCEKEQIWLISNEVDEIGAYYMKWSKSERETPILYINTYIWNFERWYRQSYMQGRKGDTDVKNRLLDSMGEGEGVMTWENSIEPCTLPHIKQTASTTSMHEAGHPKPVLWDNPEGWGGEGGGREVQDGGHMYTCPWFTLMYGKNHHNIIK